MSIVGSNALAGASGQVSAGPGPGPSGNQIDRSVRLNSSDSAYFSKTFSSAGNRQSWTWSGWVKRSSLSGSARQVLFGGYGASTQTDEFQFGFGGQFETQDCIYWTQSSSSGTTSSVYRDLSAWYHIVVSYDGSNIKIYVNGSLILTSAKTGNLGINGAWAHAVGADPNTNARLFDGYLAEVHFVDATALAASDFGELDSNNVWVPKAFSGAYNGAAGTVYSSQTITNENPSYTTDKMFDGVYGSSASLNNSVVANETDGTYSVYTFANPISYSSSVRIYGDLDTRSTDPDIKANNTSVTGVTDNTALGGANKQWYTVLSGSGTLSSVSVNQHGGYVAAIFAIEVDGTVLVDSTAPAGVNGFHLDFSDNTSTTTIAEDSSGNNNDWTANNISVAAGADNDSLIDTPTNYTASSGNNGGNYATWNALTGNTTLSNGNLDSTGKSGYNQCLSTIGMSSGKYYCEITITDDTGYTGVGIATKAVDGTFLGSSAGGYLYYSFDGNKRTSGTNSSYGNSYTTGDTIGIAFDADGGNLYFYKNGTIQNSGTAAFTGLTSGPYFFAVDQYNTSNEIVGNFGQRPFSISSVPTGYSSLCTQNFADPTIADGSTVFDTVLYTGDATSSRAITGLSFSPDFLWIKSRSSTQWHFLADVIRGANKNLASNSTAAEETRSNRLLSFDSNGFTIDNSSTVNENSSTFVAWAWDAGTSTVSNTDGTITSSVRANASAGFSIVKFTNGNGTVGHGLNSPPELIITKDIANTYTWSTYSKPTTRNAYLAFNSTAASSTVSGMWGSAEPTSSVFGTTFYVASVGNELIAYCFSSVEGYSRVGSYTGNGSTDGPFVYTGFRPKLVLVKDTTGANHWGIIDTERDVNNAAGSWLLPSDNGAEIDFTSSYPNDILSNGFKIRNNGGLTNTSGSTYLYLALAEHPFKTARAR